MYIQTVLIIESYALLQTTVCDMMGLFFFYHENIDEVEVTEIRRLLEDVVQ